MSDPEAAAAAFAAQMQQQQQLAALQQQQLAALQQQELQRQLLAQQLIMGVPGIQAPAGAALGAAPAALPGGYTQEQITIDRKQREIYIGNLAVGITTKELLREFFDQARRWGVAGEGGRGECGTAAMLDANAGSAAAERRGRWEERAVHHARSVQPMPSRLCGLLFRLQCNPSSPFCSSPTPTQSSTCPPPRPPAGVCPPGAGPGGQPAGGQRQHGHGGALRLC